MDRPALASSVSDGVHAAGALGWLVAWLGVAALTGLLALSAPLGGGAADVCLARGVPDGVAEGAGVGVERSVLPLGLTCTWHTEAATVVQPPSWFATVAVVGALAAAALSVRALVRQLRSAGDRAL